MFFHALTHQSPGRKFPISFLLLCSLLVNTQAQVNAFTSTPCLLAPALPAPSCINDTAATESQLQSAISNLNSGDTIVLAPGQYKLTKTLSIGKDNVTVTGATDNCDDIVISGPGMENKNYGNVPNGILTFAANLKNFHLAIRDVYYISSNWILKLIHHTFIILNCTTPENNLLKPVQAVLV